PSTLLNASMKTNFIYSVLCHDPSPAEIDTFNGFRTFSEKLSYLEKQGCRFEFKKTDDIFGMNLRMIDSRLPEIMSLLLLRYYATNENTVSGLTKMVSAANPENIPKITGNGRFRHIDAAGSDLTGRERLRSEKASVTADPGTLYHTSENNVFDFYAHKIKDFLTTIALGMVPGTRWDGQFQVNGGYIIVKEDGEVLCYHFYNRNEFRDYLFENTKLDTPSSSRHGFGMIEKDDDGSTIIKLNLQIRFIR
ncbi:HpaII family restriction endonuclease, partial [Methanosarcinaceae archaeon]|nr:HpaII family restriction endonuclease [Methanosarcinaceae archaeon]